jgi:hypothetical protein
VDRGVIATATELFEARHYPGVVAMVSDALDHEPECVPLLLMRARSHIALRRDLDAQADLRDIIRLDPACSLAYRLLGELAARRDENDSAAIFFREALRLDPGDREASDWLLICDRSTPLHRSRRASSPSLRSAAVANQLPAPATAAGRFPPARGRVDRARTATDARSISAPARPGSQPRFARGTRPPAAETLIATEPVDGPTEPVDRPTERFARGSAPSAMFGREPEALPPPPTRRALGSEPKPEPAPMLVIQPPRAQTVPPRPMPRGAMPELPGFGEYLVTSGILSRERLRAAQAYQRSMKVQLSTAIVTLGLATPQRIEWAAVAHQSQLARERQG